jgi:uncharacterized protein YwqG
MLADEIRRAIEGSALAGEVETIMAWVRPALRIHATRLENGSPPLGASRMGGLPDLPPGTPWPENKGRPIEFLAQIDLAEAARAFALPELPATGWLAIFYDAEHGEEPDRQGWRVLYFDGAAASLAPSEHPDEAEELFYPCTLTFEREDCLPDPSDRIPVYHDWVEPYSDDYRALVESFRPVSTGLFHHEPHHRLGGYPMLIQNGLEAEDRPEWDFALQIDSDNAPGWGWIDMGRLYFWTHRVGAGGPLHARIGEAERRARSFANAWCITEFH